MNNQKKNKNGGFPPIKYCSYAVSNENDTDTKSKERFFANTQKQNINIRQLLSESKKKPIIIIDDNSDNELEVVGNL